MSGYSRTVSTKAVQTEEPARGRLDSGVLQVRFLVNDTFCDPGHEDRQVAHGSLSDGRAELV